MNKLIYLFYNTSIERQNKNELLLIAFAKLTIITLLMFVISVQIRFDHKFIKICRHFITLACFKKKIFVCSHKELYLYLSNEF